MSLVAGLFAAIRPRGGDPGQEAKLLGLYLDGLRPRI
jgi:hypothetical protein